MAVIAHPRAGYNYTVDAELSVRTCPSCHILYAIPKQLRDRCDETGKSWYCPNGHSVVITKLKSERLREENERLERRLRSSQDTADRWRENAEQQRRSAIAYKGHLTRIRKRIANGVCPVPGCKRSGFERVMAHIASQHADWLHDHPEITNKETP